MVILVQISDNGTVSPGTFRIGGVFIEKIYSQKNYTNNPNCFGCGGFSFFSYARYTGRHLFVQMGRLWYRFRPRPPRNL